MDWPALRLSLELAAATVAVLIPLGVLFGRFLARRDFAGKSLVEALVMLPLVLPPTVLGYYLLVGFGTAAPLGAAWLALFGRPLVFTFEGLVAASVIVNIPFAVQPAQRAFEAIPREMREAGLSCGLSPWRVFARIELPLAWPGVLTALVLTFAHTLGEFGVVLMVGGSIPGETKTVAIAIYDRVQALDEAAAGRMSLLLMAVALVAIALTFLASSRMGRRLG